MKQVLRTLIFVITIVTVQFTFAQQNDTFADCYSRAEGQYMMMSERLISLYQTARIDRYEFEKARSEVYLEREQRLSHCAQKENVKLQAQVKYLRQNAETLADSRSPASLPAAFNEAYEEVQSNYEFADE